MRTPQAGSPAAARPLRVWPGVVGVALQWLGWFVLPAALPDAAMYLFLGGVLGGTLVVLAWWLVWSRAAWVERLGALVLAPAAVLATKSLVHPSVANGMMGMMLPIYSIPVLCSALVAWAAASRRLALATVPRRAALAATLLLASLGFTLVRTDGVRGEGGAELRWRWTPTPEERLLARVDAEPAVRPSAPAVAAAATLGTEAASPAPAGPPPAAGAPTAGAAAATEVVAATTVAANVEWPGFRGPDRDGVVRGVRIQTDWARSPPVVLWRRPVGPGWSSFAVQGERFYTQEQRGEDEEVSCYDLSSGNLLWRHRDSARFWESNAGPGPRATPTLGNGRVYTLGATGILNALDARDGTAAWSRNAASDTGAKLPGWGFSGSPLVVDDLVVVAASGRLAAYDAATGELRWTRDRGTGYSSPQLLTIGGVEQVVLLSSSGATSVAPADGALLWEHSWAGVPMLQPNRTSEGDLLITTGGMSGGEGTRRVAIAHGPAGWTVEERWTSRGLKPYFNDFVVHRSHAFGFDGSILSCIDLADGQRKWKGGRYGNGQLVLLPEQDLLLVLSEEGELALVRARPDRFAEVARVPGIEGKTWNHPVVVGDRLLVRNGQEMAAFRLPRAGE